MLAARPDLEAKEEVWQAFFVDYAVPGEPRDPRARLDLLAPRPGRAAGAVHRTATSRSCTRSRAGCSTRALAIRAMYPLGVGDASFLAAAEAAADDTSLMAVRPQPAARALVRAGRILQARQL